MPRSVCLLLGLTLCFGAARAASVDPEWLPLRAGSEWIYEVHRDQTYRPDDAPINRAFHLGRATRRAEAAPERGAGAFLIRETTELQPVAGRGDRETIPGWIVFSFVDGLRIRAANETNADGSQGEVVYEPPLRILPTTTVGETWNAGTFRNGAQRATVRGEVLGIEDLPGEPRWTGCLKVRLKGPISGSVASTKTPSEIESGEFERVLWFVRGVGIVREITTVSLDLKLPEERRAHTIEVLTLRLVEHRGAQ